MDSLTQITLGAAIGEAVLGRKVGTRAAIWGGICGTLPDLDSFIPYGDAVATVTYHRSFSHSIFVLALLAPLIVWLIGKIHSDTYEHRRAWLLLVFLVLITHPILDCFTVYGTQILWPFYIYPVSWSTIFIIDPAYTLPLLLGVLLSLSLSRISTKSYLFNYIGISLSTCYLLWTVTAKMHLDDIAASSLEEQQLTYNKLLTTPAPLNTMLWRVIAMDDGGYYDGYYSLFDKTNKIHFQYFPSDPSLLSGIEDHWPVQRLKWFTHGFYSVSQQDDAILMVDLRMGMEPDYIFTYKVADIGNPHPKPVESIHFPASWKLEQLTWVWQRIMRPVHE